MRILGNTVQRALLVSWMLASLHLTVSSQDFEDSNLPIVIIDTDGQGIVDDPEIIAIMHIINNGPGQMNSIFDDPQEYSGKVGIEFRGNSSQLFDKKSYALELKDEDGHDLSYPLFNMGADEDWILLAMTIDKTLMRMPLSFHLAEQMGHYAPEWAFIELIVNDDYRGLYLLTERIKRDDDRLDLAKLESDDIDGDALTGGYILQIDWLDEDDGFYSEYDSQGGIPLFIHIEYPRSELIVPEQAEYISGYINDFERAVFSPDFLNELGKRYTDYIEEESFIDFMLINELAKNSDAYKLSTFMHKDRDSRGGELKAGPIWDFDQTYGNSIFCNGHDPFGWLYPQDEPCNILFNMPLWWNAFLTDKHYVDSMACRWHILRQGPLSTEVIMNWIDESEHFIQQAVDRNYERWPGIIGEDIWAQAKPIPQSYAAEVQYMRDWIQERLLWMDVNMPGNCPHAPLNSSPLVIFPNPASDHMYVRGRPSHTLKIIDRQGQLIFQKVLEGTTELIILDIFSSGLYLVSLEADGERSTSKLIIE